MQRLKHASFRSILPSNTILLSLHSLGVPALRDSVTFIEMSPPFDFASLRTKGKETLKAIDLLHSVEKYGAQGID